VSARDVILVTGGAGFIGSHFARAAYEADSEVIVLDDLSGALGWPQLPDGIARVRGDVAEREFITDVIKGRGVTSIVHFAGKICVGESVKNPALYYESNVTCALALLDSVRESGLRKFLFSSTAAVYGIPDITPIRETAPQRPVNPYGATKLAVEHALASYGSAYGITWGALRYFNAAGAHPDGTLCEDHEPETHLIPLAIDASLKRKPPLTIFGSDYKTRDGSAIRDYIHVCDLASAHLAALDALDTGRSIGALNLGTGRGYTVLEVIQAAHDLGIQVPHAFGPRRDGDPVSLIASADRAAIVLGWKPVRSDLPTILEDTLRSRAL
jgi:UDP-glucose-4-epimerase GalE